METDLWASLMMLCCACTWSNVLFVVFGTAGGAAGSTVWEALQYLVMDVHQRSHQCQQVKDRSSESVLASADTEHRRWCMVGGNYRERDACYFWRVVDVPYRPMGSGPANEAEQRRGANHHHMCRGGRLCSRGASGGSCPGGAMRAGRSESLRVSGLMLHRRAFSRARSLSGV